MHIQITIELARWVFCSNTLQNVLWHLLYAIYLLLQTLPWLVISLGSSILSINLLWYYFSKPSEIFSVIGWIMMTSSLTLLGVFFCFHIKSWKKDALPDTSSQRLVYFTTQDKSFCHGVNYFWSCIYCLLSLDLENCNGLSFPPVTHLPTCSLTHSFFPLIFYHYQTDSFICWLILLWF